MILISHRGNIDGPNPKLENSPTYIQQALDKGYHVEIDVWYVDGKFKLGHDNPEYDFPLTLLKNNYSRLWLHCKNTAALSELNKIDKVGTKLNYFGHDVDEGVLTSKGFIWSILPLDNGVLVMPEATQNKPIESTIGICSDNIQAYA